MNLLSKVSTLIDGVKNLTLWVGSGGVVVSQEEAQKRASICLTCPLNKEGSGITREVADATKRFLEFKNQLNLRVDGEKKLFHCTGCSCVLRLMIWEPQEKIIAQMTSEELAITPSFCWKLDKP